MSQEALFQSLEEEQSARSEAEYFPTPAWCVRVLLDNCDPPLPGGYWCEPAAGEGHLIRAVEQARPGLVWGWFAADIRADAIERCRANLADLLEPKVRLWTRVKSYCEDNHERAQPWPLSAGVFITNPPFSLAFQIAEHLVSTGEIVALLLRTAFTETPTRGDFLRRHPCDLYTLDKRPRFSGGGSDKWSYAWLVWGPGRGGRWKPLECP